METGVHVVVVLRWSEEPKEALKSCFDVIRFLLCDET